MSSVDDFKDQHAERLRSISGRAKSEAKAARIREQNRKYTRKQKYATYKWGREIVKEVGGRNVFPYHVSVDKNAGVGSVSRSQNFIEPPLLKTTKSLLQSNTIADLRSHNSGYKVERSRFPGFRDLYLKPGQSANV